MTEPRPTKVTIGKLVAKSWREAPGMLRGLSMWMWAVAGIAAAVSIWADVNGHWKKLSFTLNLVSEAISAFFAVPVFLLVVSQISAYQTEEAARPAWWPASGPHARSWP